MSKLVFIDTETVRLDPAPGSVWEIAAIERTAEGDREWLWQVRPDLAIADANALRIGGFYQRFKDYPAAEFQSPHRTPEGEDFDTPPGALRGVPVEKVARALAVLLDGATLVGACPWFDAGHIESFLRHNGQAPAWTHRHIDVEALASGRLRKQQKGLAVAAQALGMVWDYDSAHTALYDARAARFIYDAVMTDDSQPELPLGDAA